MIKNKGRAWIFCIQKKIHEISEALCSISLVACFTIIFKKSDHENSQF